MSPQDSERIIIAFDGECLMCSGTIRFLAGHDPDDRIRFTPLQSERGAEMISRHEGATPDSMLVEIGGKVLSRSDGVLAVARALPFPWNLPGHLGGIIPRPVRDSLYDFIARHRYRWFGKGNACDLPSDEVTRRLL